MDRVDWLDAYYSKWIEGLESQSHELLLEVDEALLERMGLTKVGEFKDKRKLQSRFFRVVQRGDKMILYNDTFVVWIVPGPAEMNATYTWIALIDRVELGFEVGFVAKESYNTSKLVLRLLEQFLQEIEENEQLVREYDKGGQDEKGN